MRNLFVISCVLFFVSCNNTDSLFTSVESEIKTENQSVEKAKVLLSDFMEDKFKTKGDMTSFEIQDYKIHTILSAANETLTDLPTEEIPVVEFTTITDGKTGFALVVNDDRIAKVLASVEFGSLEDTAYIEPLKWFYESIPYHIANDLKEYYTPSDLKRTPLQTKSSVTTAYCFLPTIWGQHYPYNSKCGLGYCYDPPGLNGYNAAGCVALGVSQILAYYRLPSNLNWNAILASPGITTDSPQTIISTVSTLIHEVGVSLKTRYGCLSLVDNDILAQVLSSTFAKYGLKHGTRQSFSLSVVISSLQAGCPLYMSGKPAGNIGHGWICDAWKRHDYGGGTYYDYLNMNWGYGGRSNGFYIINDPMLFPIVTYSGQNVTFSREFYIVPNIRK